MKNSLVLILATLIFGMVPVFAEEVTENLPENEPAEQVIENNTAIITVQKQPAIKNSHKQDIRQNKWCIIIQVNGKVKENGTSDK